MTQAQWEFVGGVSFIVFFSALAIRGLAVGHPWSVVVGVGALLVVVVMEVATPHGWAPALPSGKVLRRLLAAGFGVFVFSSTVACVVAIDNGDWGSFLYNGVAWFASIGALFFFAYAPSPV